MIDLVTLSLILMFTGEITSTEYLVACGSGKKNLSFQLFLKPFVDTLGETEMHGKEQFIIYGDDRVGK